AREAAMQSRRARVPAGDDVTDIAAIAERPDLVIADRAGSVATAPPRPKGTGEVTGRLGPQGWVAPGGRDARGPHPRLSLGPHVLRAATAPIAAVAVLIGQTSRLLQE